MDIIWDYEMILPVNDFLVGFVGTFGAEGWVANKTFKHNRAKRPPVALVSVPLLQEDLGGNVIRRSDRRVGLICTHKPP